MLIKECYVVIQYFLTGYLLYSLSRNDSTQEKKTAQKNQFSISCTLVVQVGSLLLFSERHPGSVLIIELMSPSWAFCGIRYYGITA